MRRFFTFIKNKAISAYTAVKIAVIAAFTAVKTAFGRAVTAIREDFTPNRQLSVEQRERKTMRSVRKITAGLMAASMAASLMGITCFAAEGGGEGVETFNTVVEFIVDWVARIGLVVGFIGAVQFALGFKDDSADGKTRGLMCLASGFIVFAVAKAYDMFQI